MNQTGDDTQGKDGVKEIPFQRGAAVDDHHGKGDGRRPPKAGPTEHHILLHRGFEKGHDAKDGHGTGHEDHKQGDDKSDGHPVDEGGEVGKKADEKEQADLHNFRQAVEEKHHFPLAHVLPIADDNPEEVDGQIAVSVQDAGEGVGAQGHGEDVNGKQPLLTKVHMLRNKEEDAGHEKADDKGESDLFRHQQRNGNVRA